MTSEKIKRGKMYTSETGACLALAKGAFRFQFVTYKLPAATAAPKKALAKRGLSIAAVDRCGKLLNARERGSTA